MKKHLLILLLTILLTSCEDKNEQFNELKPQLKTLIENDQWEELFNIVKVNDFTRGYNGENIKILDDISKEIVINYKNFKLKESIQRKDSIIFGFVLNSSQSDFRNRIKELRKQYGGGFIWGDYRIQNYFLDYTYKLKGYKQHVVKDEMDCDLIINKNNSGNIVSVRIKDINCNDNLTFSYNPFKSILSKEYGRFIDIPSTYDSGNLKITYNYKKVYNDIKNNRFNVFEHYFMSNEDVFKYEKYNSSDEVIFHPRFVLYDDSISPRFLTYELFFQEYEQKVSDIRNELNKSDKNLF